MSLVDGDEQETGGGERQGEGERGGEAPGEAAPPPGGGKGGLSCPGGVEGGHEGAPERNHTLGLTAR
jgi:hypothetical protein